MTWAGMEWLLLKQKVSYISWLNVLNIYARKHYLAFAECVQTSVFREVVLVRRVLYEQFSSIENLLKFPLLVAMQVKAEKFQA